ncbi:MAG: hypothetical protein ACRD68_10265, partial [Pyrinomonadaceae bacterium]
PPALPAAQTGGITLTPISTGFNNPIGIDHHQPTNKVVLSVNYPSGQPSNFELVAPDGTRTPFSNVGGLTDEMKLATARDDGAGMSRGGFRAGELFTGTGAPGVIARVSADGSSVQNPWVTLPGEAGLLRGSLHVDRTGAFGGDLVVVTTQGGVWRVNSAGTPTLVANVGTHLEGVSTIPNDAARYGPWAGKILAGAENQGRLYAIDPQGNTSFYQLGINPEDIDLIPSHENFYGVDFGGRTLWGAPPAQFAGMAGDILIAQEFPGILWRVRWDGAAFQKTEIARVTQWEHVTFSPAGIAQIPQVPQASDKVAVVRRALLVRNGRIEGSVQQLNAENVTLNGTDTITSDFFVPGTPNVTINWTPTFNGVTVGAGNAQPSNYQVSLTDNATLRHLVTRTDPVVLDPVAPPPAPSGTRDVTLSEPGQSAGDFSTLRHLTLVEDAGEVFVPPGTYGRFSSRRNTFVFGVAGAQQPSVYNLEELILTEGARLRLLGPVVLKVAKKVEVEYSSLLGEASHPEWLQVEVSSSVGQVDHQAAIGGGSLAYGTLRAPAGLVLIEDRVLMQ